MKAKTLFVSRGEKTEYRQRYLTAMQYKSQEDGVYYTPNSESVMLYQESHISDEELNAAATKLANRMGFKRAQKVCI